MVCSAGREGSGVAVRTRQRRGWATGDINRVNRGGGWNNTARNARAANRNRNPPSNRNNELGLRPAQGVPTSPTVVASPRHTRGTTSQRMGCPGPPPVRASYWWRPVEHDRSTAARRHCRASLCSSFLGRCGSSGPSASGHASLCPWRSYRGVVGMAGTLRFARQEEVKR